VPDDFAAILRYLLPPRGSFWRWDDRGRGLAWVAGETIGFRDELLAVLRHLAATVGGGPPPLAAVLLLLTATRDNWPTVAQRLVAHAEQVAGSAGGDTSSAVGVTLRAIGHRLPAEAAAVSALLDRVAALPSHLRRPTSAKATLAEIVFANAAAAAAPTTAAVVAVLEKGTDPSLYMPPGRLPHAVRELVDALDALGTGLDKVDADRLATRLATGLDGAVRPADADVGPIDRARQLLADTSVDDDVSAVTRLARGLLAAVAVPRPVGAPDDHPAGGVSDLSNRGPLDRLLLSELAHDDLTLAVRVAVNEALYLQRETPPRQPPRRRTVLIDTGVRTWGVPRVYATAVALALVATADADVTAYRPDNGGVAPADLTTAAGVTAQLAALDGRAHFGDALGGFVAATEGFEGVEPFLVTTADVLDDADFQRALREHGPARAYAAAVQRDGTFHLWHLSPAGRRLVRQAKLDLNRLLAPPPKHRTPVPLLEPSGDLPTILSVVPFPLRLPLTSPLRRTAGEMPDGFFGVTVDRRLLTHAPGPDGGPPVQLTDRLPRGRLVWLSVARHGTVVAVFVAGASGGRPMAWTRVVHRPDTGRTEITPLAVDFTVHEVVERHGLLYLLGRRTAAVFDLSSPEPLATVATPAKRVRGRVFIDDKNGCALLAWDGTRLALEPVPVPAGQARQVFEWAGHDGPLVIGPAGEIAPVGAPGEPLVAGTGRTVWMWGVSGDGSRVVGRAYKPDMWFQLGLAGSREWVGHPPHSNAAWDHWYLGAWVRLPPTTPAPWTSVPLRNRFNAAYVDAAGTLGLTDKHDLAFEVRLAGADLRLVPNGGTPEHVAHGAAQPFTRTVGPDGVGYMLRVAKWPDGSRAYVDSRGLLHLRPADRTIPEVTLVLPAAGPLAGWSSDGRVYGPCRFHGQQTSFDFRMLDELIRRFTGPLR
jgi:hypothetical protein